MAEVDSETRDTNMEQNDSRKQLKQVTEHGVTEVGVTSNQNISVDNDNTHGRCYSCCKSCMTEQNPLPASPTRFDIIDFLSQLQCLCVIAVYCIVSMFSTYRKISFIVRRISTAITSLKDGLCTIHVK